MVPSEFTEIAVEPHYSPGTNRVKIDPFRATHCETLPYEPEADAAQKSPALSLPTFQNTQQRP
jgi:hypothetical protein